MKITEILTKQMFLDKHINNIRKRETIDCVISSIGECIEFIEEHELTHKTWKSKETVAEKLLEEYVDIIFFLAQTINKKGYPITEHFFNNLFHSNTFKTVGRDVRHMLGDFIVHMLCDNTHKAIIALGEIAKELGYTDTQIENMYHKKWEINMKRISTEWR